MQGWWAQETSFKNIILQTYIFIYVVCINTHSTKYEPKILKQTKIKFIKFFKI